MHPIRRQFRTAQRRRREAAGLSQEALAEGAGLHRDYVGFLERGQRVPSILAVHRLAAALGTTMARLLAEVEREHSQR